MSAVSRLHGSRARLLAAGVAVVLAGLPLAGCKEVEEEEASGYVPATLEALKGSDDDLQRITFTEEGADRVDLATDTVRRAGGRKVIPYAALIYNDEAKTFVYTSPKPLTFLRAPVRVDRIEEDKVYLSVGPAAGTKVVTVGATEVYGAEIDMAGSH